nr:MAG TPA: hypothetical protein [Microviridae sp.]
MSYNIYILMQLYCECPVILVNHRLGYYLSIWRKCEL